MSRPRVLWAVTCVGTLVACAGGGLRHAPPTAPKPTADTVGSLPRRDVDIHVDRPIVAGAQRAIENYQRYVDVGAGSPAVLMDAMRRLGDLRLEVGEYERSEADSLTASPADTRAAIQIYTRALQRFPNYVRNDAVLYQLARAYEAERLGTEALQSLEQLASRYPTSRYAAEADFRRGEIYFSAQRFNDAEAAYQKVIAEGGRSEFHEQSLYKLGWTRYKRGDAERALEPFAALLDRYLVAAADRVRARDELTPPQRELVDDTLRICAIIFSFDDGTDGIARFTAKAGIKPYDRLLYDALGDLYIAKERYTDAAQVFHAFADRSPNDANAPAMLARAVDAQKRGQFISLVVDAKRDLADRYAPDAAFWREHPQAQDSAEFKELRSTIEDLAEYYHSQAQRSKLPADYAEAAKWYQKFLAYFPTDAAAARMNYALADVLFESGQYAPATAEYLHVAYDYPVSERSPVAAYAALVAYDKHESELADAEQAAWHRQSREEALRFARQFPNHPESAAVLVRAARSWYDDKAYPEALVAANEVLKRQGAAPLAERQTAWTVIANAQFELGAYAEAEAAYLGVLRLLPSDDTRRAAMRERVAACIYKGAEQRRASGQDKDAVGELLRVAEVTPDATIRATADYDAASLLIGLKDWPRAIEVLERLRRDFPASELQPEVTRRLAVAYSETGRWASAATEFRRISSTATVTPSLQREALALAAQYYETAGDVRASAAVLEEYLKRFGDDLEFSMEARQKLVDFALARHDAATAERWRREMVRVDASVGELRSARMRSLAAHAALALALPARDTFLSIRLTLPLKRSLDAKRQALQKALAGFESADQYAIADVSTQATYEMAELYRALASDLMASERPKKMSADTLEQYDLLLEEQAFPFEEQAIDLHLLNVGRTRDGLYDDAIKASFGVLARVKPARFAKVEVLPALIGATAASPDGNDEALAHAAALAAAGRYADALAAYAALPADRVDGDVLQFNQGVLLLQLGRLDDAEKTLSSLTMRGETAVAGSIALGVTLRSMGRFSQAEAAYRRALEQDPKNVTAHRNYGVLLDLYIQKPEDALVHYQNARDELTARSADGGPLDAYIAEVKQRLAAMPKASEAAEATEATEVK